MELLIEKKYWNWDKMETVIILKLFWTETWLEWSEEKTQRVLEESLTCYISRSTVIVINKQEKPTQFIFNMFRNTTGKYNTVQVYPKQFLRLSCKHGLRWSLVVHIWILTQRNWIKSDRKVDEIKSLDQIIIKTLLSSVELYLVHFYGHNLIKTNILSRRKTSFTVIWRLPGGLSKY